MYSIKAAFKVYIGFASHERININYRYHVENIDGKKYRYPHQ